MVWHKYLLLFLTATTATLHTYAEEKACTAHLNGKFYDLNPLRSSKDYEIKTLDGHLLVFNICGRINRDPFGMKDIDASKIAGFLRRDHGDISIGALNTTITVFESHPRLTFLEGSPCKSQSDKDGQRASAVIDFVCDTSVFGVGKPRLVASFPPYDDENACGFAIEWRTQLACPTSEDGGGWGLIAILAVTILSLLMFYAVLGTLYNRFVLNLRGFDQIPQFSVESMRYHASEAWDWMKDVYANYRQNGGFRSYEGYRPAGGIFRAENDAPTNPVSHHTQSQADSSDSGAFRLGPGDVESVGGSRGGFVRPTPRISPNTRGVETNPVSHYTQSQQIQYQSQQPPSPPPKQPPAKPQAESSRGASKEAEFSLSDDDESDEQELDDVRPSSNNGSSTTTSGSEFPSTSIGRGTSDRPQDATALRGRDLDGGGVTRL
ncbi:hypothetical protein AX16_010271 [Volvariella volvacea WC 439]|nr:hypothetical protein AX16_010271 [Volvariella volvacea WC 439]